MLQAVHSEATGGSERAEGAVALFGEASGRSDPPRSGGPPGAAFGPALQIALSASALQSTLLAQPAAADRAADALAGGPQQRSAAAHWAAESRARAAGQSGGVNLAEIASNEMAQPAGSGVSAQSAPAPDAPRESVGREAEPGRTGEQPGRSAEAPARERAASGSSSQPEPDARQQDSAGTARSHVAPNVRAQAPAQMAAGTPGQAQAGAGQVSAGATGSAHGGAGSATPISTPALRLEAAGPAGSAKARGAPAAQTPSRAMQTQIERGLGAVLRQGGGSLTLRLKPDSLGDLRIEMTLDKGSVRARFEASTPEARDLMLANLGALRAALEARGLRIEALEVTAPDRHDPADRPPEAPRQPEQSDNTGRRHEQAHDRQSDRNGAHGAGDEPGEDNSFDDNTPAPEDPAHQYPEDDAAESLVRLPLDTVA